MAKNTIVLQVLKDIEAEKGKITPQDVVEEAQDFNSPIHDYFEWDDSEAAEKYRLWQARQLIASVKVEWMGKQTDAYYTARVVIDEEPQQAYYSAEKVFNNEDLYKQVLKSAVSELRYWQTKYKELKEIKEVINDVVLSDIEKSL